MLRKLGWAVLVFGIAWGVAVAALAVAMRQPPAAFGRIMARVPMPAFLVLPFETLWRNARAGALRTGDAAPRFSLATLDRRSRVSLPDLRGRPVLLVFGSYT